MFCQPHYWKWLHCNKRFRLITGISYSALTVFENQCMQFGNVQKNTHWIAGTHYKSNWNRYPLPVKIFSLIGKYQFNKLSGYRLIHTKKWRFNTKTYCRKSNCSLRQFCKYLIQRKFIVRLSGIPYALRTYVPRFCLVLQRSKPQSEGSSKCVTQVKQPRCAYHLHVQLARRLTLPTVSSPPYCSPSMTSCNPCWHARPSPVHVSTGRTLLATWEMISLLFNISACWSHLLHSHKSLNLADFVWESCNGKERM